MYFHYELRDAGWATARFGPDENIIVMTVSDLTDSLRNLASETYSICNGAQSVEVLFEDEPGGHWLRIRRRNERTLDFEIVWKEDYGEKEESVCRGEIGIDELRRLVVSELKRVLDEHGEAGYRAKWPGFEFPMAELRKLEGAG